MRERKKNTMQIRKLFTVPIMTCLCLGLSARIPAYSQNEKESFKGFYSSTEAEQVAVLIALTDSVLELRALRPLLKEQENRIHTQSIIINSYERTEELRGMQERLQGELYRKERRKAGWRGFRWGLGVGLAGGLILNTLL